MRLRLKARYKPNFSFQRSTIPRAKQRVGHRQGALVRTIARRSIRRKKKPSKPGKPPRNVEGQLKKFLFYSWDPGLQSVIVGPEKLPGTKADAPAVLEGTKRRRRYRARPFMRPALDKAKAKLPELWAGAIK